MKCALINKKTNLVENVIVIDDLSSFVVHDGFIIHPYEDATIGDVWDGTECVHPPEPPISPENQKKLILSELNHLDIFIPRGLEDYFTIIGFDTTKLPKVQQDRLAQKADLRTELKSINANS